jgi:hypothetical protein
MEYKCKTISVAQLTISPIGFVMPLCESCKVKDCTNPIEKINVSVVGVSKKIRAFNRGLEPRFVVQCEGYI